MRSSLSSVVAVPGACCRTTFRPGRLSISTSGAGGTMAPGSAGMIYSAVTCEWPLGSAASPAPRSSRVNRSRPRKKGGAWIRCRQTGQRPQAAYSRRYPWTDPDGGRDGRQCAGPGWRETAPGDAPASLYAVATHLGGWRLHWAAGGVGQGAASPTAHSAGDYQAI